MLSSRSTQLTHLCLSKPIICPTCHVVSCLSALFCTFQFSNFSPFIGVTAQTDGMCNVPASPLYPVSTREPQSLPSAFSPDLLFKCSFLLSPLDRHPLSILPFLPTTSPRLTLVHCQQFWSVFFLRNLHTCCNAQFIYFCIFCSHLVSCLFVRVQVCGAECVPILFLGIRASRSIMVE